ncbi:MAG: hypothetical protein KA261_12905 [candidate division Zixibacteria bacterium]|nr:hypothetical protein [candidate division Zixibacteria bacterium]
MKELKRTFHKQRKWVCPKCGRVRFQRRPADRRPPSGDR